MTTRTVQHTKGLLLITSLIFSLPTIAKVSWTKVAPGLYYTATLPNPLKTSAKIIAFRINPAKYQFNSVIAAKELNTPTAYITQFAKQTHSTLAINGGYFSRTQYPLGLRINNYQVLSRLKKISWWGVFYLRNNRPYLSTSSNFRRSKNISFAVQAGPRLVVNGQVMKLKPGIADRSAIGMTRNGKIIIAITQNLALSLSGWATQLKNIGCSNALNLDGGSSSQLYADTKAMKFVVPNYKAVTDVIAIKAR